MVCRGSHLVVSDGIGLQRALQLLLLSCQQLRLLRRSSKKVQRVGGRRGGGEGVWEGRLGGHTRSSQVEHAEGQLEH